MRIAISGGSGFVGRHLARSLQSRGHSVLLIGRPGSRIPDSLRGLPDIQLAPIGLDDPDALSQALEGCEALAHLAGINREIGRQTYCRVHIDGTRNLVQAAERAGVARVASLSFLRARPNCGSAYHESKWAAEEIVRGSSLTWTVVKAGMIYGRGDHMLDHMSHAIRSLPIFLGVGRPDPRVAPLAVADVVRVFEAALLESRLPRSTLALVGPEAMSLRELYQRIASSLGKRRLYLSAPLILHRILAVFFEASQQVPLVSRAQVRILSEGVVEASGTVDPLPAELMPQRRLTADRIQAGLPEGGGLWIANCRLIPNAHRPS